MDRPVKSEDSKKIRTRHLDRITINQEALTKLNDWLNQIESVNKGIRVTRTDLVNWLIKDQPQQLSGGQLKEIEEAHFDPVKYARWAYLEVKAARANGKNLALRLIEEESVNDTSRPKRTYKKRAKSEEPLSFKEIRAAEETTSDEVNSD